MRFKNASQRKAVMSKLKGQNFQQLRRSGIRLSYQGDYDKDGVVNIHDCKPLDDKKRGFFHRKVKAKSIDLEKEQDKLLKEIDKESTTLNKQLKLEKRLQDNKKLKDTLSQLKKERFYHTKTGKVVVGVGVAGKSVSKTTMDFIKKPSTKKFIKGLFK